jgi:hypothetical protein
VQLSLHLFCQLLRMRPFSRPKEISQPTNRGTKHHAHGQASPPRSMRPCRCFEHEMPSATAPEIQRTSLVGAVLYLKSLPLDIDVLGFDYLDAPDPEALRDALRQLWVLDALDVDGRVGEGVWRGRAGRGGGKGGCIAPCCMRNKYTFTGYRHGTALHSTACVGHN